MDLNFSDINILVVGDIILDKYIIGDVNRISPEAPVPVIKYDKNFSSLGGAANVANNLVKLGCSIDLLGLIGKSDDEGNQVRHLLLECGIRDKLIDIDSIPTITKTRIISSGHQICRIDQEKVFDNNSLILSLIKKMNLKFEEYDVLVLSDYNKGIIQSEVSSFLINKFNELGKKIIIDPKKDDWSIYKRASIITPNFKEFTTIAKYCPNTEKEIVSHGRKIINKYDLQNILVTRSEKGMLWVDKDTHINIKTEAKEVFDVSGAGDTVIATLSACIAKGVNVEKSINYANIAASIVVGKTGTCPVTLKELKSKINNVPDKYVEISYLKSNYFDKKDTDFTVVLSVLEDNSFGYIENLKSHKNGNGHNLFLAVYSDNYFEFKFKKKPTFKAFDKITLFSHLDFIDGVTLITNVEDETLINQSNIKE
jgi:D-beta-D-heptose 7-phosphate kinase / D-beta-D-heptose 1-phosphate adenosyltransferase